jgi:hypothetical protein
MLAGRYLWWTMVCIAGFFAMAIHFEYLVWLSFRVFGCRTVVSGCGKTAGLISETGQILALCLVTIVILGVTLVRLNYVRWSMAWFAATVFWVIDFLPVAASVDDIWHKSLDPSKLLLAPPSTVFLIALCAMLSLPLEASSFANPGMLRKVQIAGSYVAVVLAVAGLIVDPVFATAVLRQSAWPVIGTVALLQQSLLNQPQIIWASEVLSGYQVFFTFISVTCLVTAIWMIVSERAPQRSRRSEILARSTIRRRA